MDNQVFYWTAVVTTFALGTSAGDMTASTMKLGYLASGVLFAVLIGTVGIAYYVSRRFLTVEYRQEYLNAVLAFWLAYILTRPLGASFADWMGKEPRFGGLGWGDGIVSVVLTAMILTLVAYLARTRVDIEETEPAF